MKTNSMKSRMLMLITAMVFCLTSASADAVFGGKTAHFTADSVTIDPSGKVVHTGKLYVSGDVMRMDDVGGMTARGIGGKAPDLSILAFKKQGKMFFYNHDKKLVYEGPLEEEDMIPGYKAMNNVASEQVVGEENVSGYMCVKKEIITRINIMGMNRKEKLTVWESDRFEFPLRTMTYDGGVQEMRNIKEGKPSKKLFRRMPGYKRVNNIMAVMGMEMGGMMGKGSPEKNSPETAARPGRFKASHGGTPAYPDRVQPLVPDKKAKQVIKEMDQLMRDTSITHEEKAELMASLKQSMGEVKKIKHGKGASQGLWHIIPKRGNDKVVYEMKTDRMMDAGLGTNASLQQVFDFYGNILTEKGWQNGGSHIQNEQGFIMMVKDHKMIRISSSKKPRDTKENFSLYYYIHYTGMGN